MILKLCKMAHKICPNITPELKEKIVLNIRYWTGIEYCAYFKAQPQALCTNFVVGDSSD